MEADAACGRSPPSAQHPAPPLLHTTVRRGGPGPQMHPKRRAGLLVPHRCLCSATGRQPGSRWQRQQPEFQQAAWQKAAATGRLTVVEGARQLLLPVLGGLLQKRDETAIRYRNMSCHPPLPQRRDETGCDESDWGRRAADTLPGGTRQTLHAAVKRRCEQRP